VVLSPQDVDFIKSRVIHQDDHLIIFDKPSGLSSQGGRINAHTLDDLTWAFARSNGNRPRLIHRLDRDTSGVLLSARTQPAAGFLGKAMIARRFRKTYLAIVGNGGTQPSNGVIETALRREMQGREAFIRTCDSDHPDADSARTLYRTLVANDQAALVELRPETGRMHQLRVHMASIGRPICGDPRYGGALVLAGVPVPRLMLHALRLKFPHPAGGEHTAVAPVPMDFQTVLAAVSLSIPPTIEVAS
jgi:RluA family pseudouridine synthase